MRRPGLGAATWTGLAVFAVSMATHFRIPLLPDIGADLAMTPAVLGLLTTLFGLGRLLADFPAGLLVDRYGTRPMFLSAALFVCGGAALFATARSAQWVLGAAVVLGLASAVANTTGMTYFSTRSPVDRRGRALGGYAAALLGGQALGPALGGGIASVGSWRTAMWAAVAVGFAVGVAAAASGQPVGRAAARTRLRRPASDPSDDGRTATVPFTLPQRVCLYSVPFSVMFVLGSMPQTLVPIIGSISLGLPVGLIGLALGLGGAARVAGAFAGGHLSDITGRKAVLVPGLVLQAAGVALLAFEASLLFWLAAIVLMSLTSFGIGVGAAILGDRVEHRRAGRELGIYRFVGDVGLLLGPTLAAGLFARVGQAPTVLAVAALLAAAALATAFIVPETHETSRPVGRADARRDER